MIRLIEARSYRCLRYVSQEIGTFQILVGANASGKSTFLDTPHLLGDLLANGLQDAVSARSPSLEDVIWKRQGGRLEIAVELEIPADRRRRLPQNGYGRARYEVAVGFDARGELAVLGETLWLKPAPQPPQVQQCSLFPSPPSVPSTIVRPLGRHTPPGWRKVVTKRAESGNDYFMSEVTGWHNLFRLGPKRLALANLPEDEDRFPVAVWVKRTLMEGMQWVALNSEAMRRPSPPGRPSEFQPDGSNLPWAIEKLAESNETAFQRWIAHIRTALPDIRTVETEERPEDRHRYLRVVYCTGLKVPSWAVSDGTLRLLALTVIPYLAEPDRIYLIEEPENGIHPRGVETVFQSLSSSYESQILCASHSPVLLSLADPAQVLCFARTDEGATDIVRGDRHPNLRDWKRDTDLGTLFATGVLG